MNANDSSHEINRALIQFEAWQDERSSGGLEDFIAECDIAPVVAEGLRRTREFESRLRKLASNRDVDEKTELLGGQVIDNYRFVRRLGVGGMGTVWLAEQLTPVHREVAIKLIRPGLDTEHFEKRFEAEQQALAMMSHPHIAKVLNAGRLDDGRPYFVMDFVPGLAITDYCNVNKLSLRNRLALFLQLCDAIQHAHQKGLLHRDIKPMNVLITDVDSKPSVKVIDFGLVKDSSGDSNLTQFAMPLGSPMWMSPEQALGRQDDSDDVDTRTDIYSLGVILYQLLTNSTPITEEFFQSSGPLEVLEAIREQEIPYPSLRLSKVKSNEQWLEQSTTSSLAKWSQLLRNDLDWIAMKALEKDRERRYASASALSDDVNRFLNDEPIVARPPAFRYRFGKLVKKHRVIAGASVAIVASLMMATLISIMFAFWAANEREIAERERAKLQRFVDVSIGGLGQLNKSGSVHSVQTRKYLQVLSERTDEQDFSNDPLTEASFRFTIGQGLMRSGMDEHAIEEFKKVLAINADNPSSDAELTISTTTLLALALSRTERTTEAEKLASQAIELAEEKLGEDHRLTAEAKVALNTARNHGEKFLRAQRELKQLQAFVEEQYGKSDSMLIDIKTQLAKSCSGNSDFAAAVKYFDEAISLVKKDSPAASELIVNQWEANAKKQKLHHSPEDLLKSAEAKAGRFPDTHPINLSLRDRCGDILFHEGNHKKALEVYENNLQLCKQNRGRKHQNTSNCLRKIGLTHAVLGNFKQAVAFIEEANEITIENFGDDSLETLRGRHDLSMVYFMKSDLKKSLQIADSVLKSPVLFKDSPLRDKLEKLKTDCVESGGVMTAVNVVESLFKKLPILKGTKHKQ